MAENAPLNDINASQIALQARLMENLGLISFRFWMNFTNDLLSATARAAGDTQYRMVKCNCWSHR